MTAFCTVSESGWHDGDSATDLAFSATGQVLATELRRWRDDESLSLRGPEEVGAVLEGRFALECGEERHELTAGQGILIPADEPHCWRVLSASGVLYRVIGPESLA